MVPPQLEPRVQTQVVSGLIRADWTPETRAAAVRPDRCHAHGAIGSLRATARPRVGRRGIISGMTPDSPNGREWLREIARRAMRDRGFEPDFPPAVLAETEALSEPAARPDGPRRGPARARLGLDRQRRLARPRPALGRGGAEGRLACGCSWRWPTSTRRSGAAARSTSGRARTRPPSTRRRRSSRCCPSGCRPTSPRSTRTRTGSRSWSR